MLSNQSNKRLDPHERRSKILIAAVSLLDREGFTGFSLEATAREAQVAASLPRHYFGSSTNLLREACLFMHQKIEEVFFKPRKTRNLKVLLSEYLSLIQQHPWGHDMWMNVERIEPTFGDVIHESRRRLASLLVGQQWTEMNREEQSFAMGAVGFVEVLVADWIWREFQHREETMNALATGLRKLSS